MERERPEYLPPIERPRWSFPWLTLIGVVVLALAVFGIRQHLATQAAWNQRFNKPIGPMASPPAPVSAEAAQAAKIQREQEDAEIVRRFHERQKDRESWRCINGIPFRQIPGGWENVPGERC